MEDFQVREEHWVIADLIGKGKHIRTVPVPVWAKRAVDEWTGAAKIDQGAIFRRVSRQEKVRGEGLTSSPTRKSPRLRLCKQKRSSCWVRRVTQ